MISDRLWARRFQRDPAAVGRALIIGGRSYPIVGVMPGTFTSAATDVWLPAQTNAWLMRQRDARFLGGVGRLRPGVSVEAAGRELASIQEALAREFPKTDAGWSAEVRSLKEARHRRLAARARAGLRRGRVPVDHRGREHRRADARPGPSARARARDPLRPWRLARTRDWHGHSRGVAHRGARRRARRRSGRLARIAHADARCPRTPRINELTLDWRALAFVGATSLLAACAFSLVSGACGLASTTEPRRSPPAAAASPEGSTACSGSSSSARSHSACCWSDRRRCFCAATTTSRKSIPASIRRARSPSTLERRWAEDRWHVGQLQEQLLAQPRATAARPGGRADQLPARNRRDAALPGLRRGPDGTERGRLDDGRHTHDQRQATFARSAHRSSPASGVLP